MHWEKLRTYAWEELYLRQLTHLEELRIRKSYAPGRSYAGGGGVIHLGARWEELCTREKLRNWEESYTWVPWWQELRIETSDALGRVKHWEELCLEKRYVPRRSYAVGGVRHLGARWEELCTWEKLHNGRSYTLECPVGGVTQWEELCIGKKLRVGKSYGLAGVMDWKELCTWEKLRSGRSYTPGCPVGGVTPWEELRCERSYTLGWLVGGVIQWKELRIRRGYAVEGVTQYTWVASGRSYAVGRVMHWEKG